MSELYLISCARFKCGMWALNPHSLNPAKRINNYAKSIQQLIEVFSVWYGCQKGNINFIQIFAWYVEWKKKIHSYITDSSLILEIRKRYLWFHTHFLCGYGGDFATWHPIPPYYTQLYLSYVKVLRRIQICIILRWCFTKKSLF